MSPSSAPSPIEVSPAPSPPPGAAVVSPRTWLGFSPVIARLTVRGLLGRRRTLLLITLPLLLVAIAVAIRAATGQDHDTTIDIVSGLALATVVPLIGVIAGTGAIGPEIDDGSIIFLLAKPISRPLIVRTKLVVATACTIVFAAVPTFVAALVLSGTSERIAVGFGAAAIAASIAYSAIFLLLGVITRHAVVIGLVYALVWEGLVGSFVQGARTLSVQQWSLSLAEKISSNEHLTAAVNLPTGVVLLVVVTLAAVWYGGQRLRSLMLKGEE